MRHGSVRVRLTLLFGGLFLVAGAALLGITYGLVSHATSGIIISRISSYGAAGSGSAGSGSAASGAAGAGSAAGTSAPGALPAPGALSAQTLATAQGAQAEENDTLLLYSGIALAIMAVVSVALGWFAAGRALRPLRRITGAAQRISATNLHERLALDGPDDDLRELADTIDDLFARLDASFDAQRQFVANASHELRTPLARSRTLLEVALRDPAASATSLRTACERALAAGAEQERLIEALLTLARGQRGLARREPLDLAAITRDVLAARSSEIAARGLAVAVTLAPALLAGDAALAERAVANLVDNALRHNVADGTVTVSVESADGRAAFVVANSGPEVPPGEVDRLLLPFQRGPVQRGGASRFARTRSGPDAGLGLGLGLSIVSAVAAAHGAAFDVTPRLTGGGLIARLTFPAPPRAWLSPADPEVVQLVR
jgi:signal transduction histidine kinase